MTKISNQYSLTNILTADLANSRLGINNVSPTVALDVTGAGKFSGALTVTGGIIASAANGNIRIKGSTDGFLGAGDADNKLYLTDWTTGAKGLTILLTTGAATFSNNITIGNSLTYAYIYGPSSQILASVGGNATYLFTGTSGCYFNNAADTLNLGRITNGGNFLFGTTTDYNYKLVLRSDSTGDTSGLMYMLNSANTTSLYVFAATNTFMNTSDALVWMKRNGTTSRSINASGTINASGADYAEYMVKETTDDIAKGDIVGVNSNGKLTNIFADSVSFVIKSTDPSYVGGDTWFNVEPPLEKDFKSKNEFEIAYEEFKVKREEARNKVDRIAFSGQIPCNVLGANVGDYIIPINNNGRIKGQSISNPTFEQYQNSIAKVWKIMEDGRAWVAVKIG
jgi:hypothetical protein